MKSNGAISVLWPSNDNYHHIMCILYKVCVREWGGISGNIFHASGSIGWYLGPLIWHANENTSMYT